MTQCIFLVIRIRVFLACLFLVAASTTSFAAIVGDINHDGKIDLTEAMYALQVSAGAYPNLDPSFQLVGKGAWSSGADYVECDVVTEDGSTYACNADHTSGVFNDDLTSWNLLTTQGPQGIQGPQGDIGDAGPPGVQGDPGDIGPP
jgi:hypothetical protein